MAMLFSLINLLQKHLKSLVYVTEYLINFHIMSFVDIKYFSVTFLDTSITLLIQ